MTLSELSSLLVQHREKPFRILLPGGSTVPVSFHITEVGHVAKKFIDCGGQTHRIETCQLQVWVGEDEHHRLEAGKLLGIIGKARLSVLPANADSLPVEIEYENELISQYGIESSSISDDSVVLHLTTKHTDCLAKELCVAPAPGGSACCGGGKCC